jgi:hypothetical protein
MRWNVVSREIDALYYYLMQLPMPLIRGAANFVGPSPIPMTGFAHRRSN